MRRYSQFDTPETAHVESSRFMPGALPTRSALVTPDRTDTTTRMTARPLRERDAAARQMWQGLGQAWTAISYLVCGIALWGGVGYLLDRAIGTRPILFVVGTLIGNAGGIYLVYLRTMGAGRAP